MPSRTACASPRPTPAGASAPSASRLRHSSASLWVTSLGRKELCTDQPRSARSSMIEENGKEVTPKGYRRSLGSVETPLQAASLRQMAAVPVCASTSTRRRTENEQRSEEHTSELQSLMRSSYDVFSLKKKKHIIHKHH